VSGRKNDTLDFENQDLMAVDAGFAERFGLSPAERMMRRYYLHAREGAAVSKELIDTAVRQVFGNIGGPSWFRRETLSPPFRIMKGWLVAEPPSAVLDPPHRMIEAYAVSARRGAPISAGLKRLIRENLKIASGPLRADRAAAAHFREILSGQRVSRTLREMHTDGILGRYMPEFGRLRALVVREPYHRYTVDEHTLNAVKAVESLGDPALPAHGMLRDALRAIGRRHILYLAVLIHDAGKALRTAGAHEHADVSEILERLRVSGDDRRLVEFLVRNHLLMSVTALKREIDNPEVVREFAASVEDIERLDYLFLLTYADMSAVRPGFWSGWRQYLVTELYARAAAHLRGELRGERRSVLLAGVPERGNPSRLKVEEHLDIYSKRYLRETPDDTVPGDVLLLDAARSGGFACRVTKRPAMGGAEITVCAIDRPGLLAGFARILSSAGLDILKAQAYTGSDNTVLDRFTISNWDDVYWRGIEDRLSDEFRAFIRDDSRRPATPPGKGGKALGIEPSITVDNELSQRVTAIEIVTPDRIGLLADMFYAIHDAGLDVVSARIQTDGGVASDIIYTRKAGFQPLLSAIAGLREILFLSHSD
jgi:[protein-PII] uridylyltransferase